MKTLTTERLILRSFTMDDAADFMNMPKTPTPASTPDGSLTKASRKAAAS